MLAYFAVESERPQRREKLASLLWPDYPEASARTSLRRALANLRDVIHDRDANPPFLQITRQAIQVNPASDAQVDVAVFSDLVKGDITQKQLAAELYRGEFLEGFSIPDSIPFEEWLVITRGALRGQALGALHQLVRQSEG